jgi:hypothetical protein
MSERTLIEKQKDQKEAVYASILSSTVLIPAMNNIIALFPLASPYQLSHLKYKQKI